LTLLEVLAESINNIANGRAEATEAESVEKVDNLGRQVLEQALALLEVLSKGVDNVTDGRAEATEAKAVEKVDDLR
jgi:hypothetical protein